MSALQPAKPNDISASAAIALPSRTDIVRPAGQVRNVPIVLQKPFCVTEDNFSGP
jgi:hypothetical protein